MPLGEAYVDNQGNDAPAEVVMKLRVEKAAASIGLPTAPQERTYTGKPLSQEDISGIVSTTDGALTYEFKPAEADDSAYATTGAPNAGKYTVRISSAETATFKAAFVTMPFEITQKEVTIKGASVRGSKVYDGNADAAITNGGTVAGKVGGDDLAVQAGAAQYDNKNTGAGKSVTFTGFALSGAAKDNYTLTAQPAGVPADITPKELTVENLRVRDKFYDGTTAAQLDGIPTLNGVVDGEDVSLLCGTPSFTAAAIGDDIAFVFTAFALDGAEKDNYTLTQSRPALRRAS